MYSGSEEFSLLVSAVGGGGVLRGWEDAPGRERASRRHHPRGTAPGQVTPPARRLRGVCFHVRSAAEGRSKLCLLTKMENEALFRTCR